MVHEITIEEYIKQSEDLPIIDVRSPKEYEKGHIINAVNIPLFSNDERAHVGTVYKRKTKEKAIELGYKYVNPKLDYFVSESNKQSNNKRIAVHCWRGGMRSRSFAELLDENGFEVYLIKGGYKTFRNHVLDTFDKSCTLIIVGGYTGSGKTLILDELEKCGEQMVDLEGLANHKGSAFGAIKDSKQPTTEQFENNLFWHWKDFDLSKTIWVEDESANIGNVNIPENLFKKMRISKVLFLQIPKEARAKFLVDDYGNIDDEAMAVSIGRISKRLGGLKTSQSLEMLEKKDYYNVALNCLAYYDKYYLRGLLNRDKELVQIINLDTVDIALNTKRILDCK